MKCRDGACKSTGTSGTGSFLPGTQIVMSDKTTRNIEDIRAGDNILSYDTEKKKIVSSHVSHVFSHEMPGYYVIDNNLKITATNPIWANDQWVYPLQLNIGDQMMDSNGNADYVDSIYYVERDVTVYNLQVEKTYTYFAEFLLV